MLPRELGGVVDANLRVYGLGNVRVADASVVPISLSTHLMASTYGVAEQASSIIRNFYRRKSATVTHGPASFTSDPDGNSRQFNGKGNSDSDDSDDSKSNDSPSGMPMSTLFMGIIAVQIVVASIFSL